MNYLAWAKDLFKDDIYATETTGIEILEVELNYAKCSLNINKSHMNAGNSVMGGAIFTLADFTFAIASNTEKFPTVTLNSQINYLSPAKSDKLIAEAKCIKRGKSTCFFEIEVKDTLDNIVAIVTSTGFSKS